MNNQDQSKTESGGAVSSSDLLGQPVVLRSPKTNDELVRGILTSSDAFLVSVDKDYGNGLHGGVHYLPSDARVCLA